MKIRKDEAMQILQCSAKTLERYVAQGKLSRTYEKGSTRDVAMYEKEEVQALAAKNSVPKVAGQVVNSQETLPAVIPANEKNKLQKINRDNRDKTQTVAIDGFQFWKKVGLSPAEKLMLTIKDCVLLTSLSEHFIREAIKTGELDAKKHGRGWKVKRVALDAFIETL